METIARPGTASRTELFQTDIEEDIKMPLRRLAGSARTVGISGIILSLVGALFLYIEVGRYSIFPFFIFFAAIIAYMIGCISLLSFVSKARAAADSSGSTNIKAAFKGLNRYMAIVASISAIAILFVILGVIALMIFGNFSR